MVIVNTVVTVQAKFKLDAQDTALALAFFGGGSMLAALSVPALLKRFSDRSLMLSASLLLVLGLLIASQISELKQLLVIWALLGIGYALVQTPSGRLLTRSAHHEDRPDLFAAQFSLSHACWLLAYPLAGWLGVSWEMMNTFLVFALIALLAAIIGWRLWPANDLSEIEHCHDELPEGHPHLKEGQRNHKHPYVIDDLHIRWPR